MGLFVNGQEILLACGFAMFASDVLISRECRSIRQLKSFQITQVNRRKRALGEKRGRKNKLERKRNLKRENENKKDEENGENHWSSEEKRETERE